MIVINRVKTLGNGLINGFLFWLFYPTYNWWLPRRKNISVTGVHVLFGIHLKWKILGLRQVHVFFMWMPVGPILHNAVSRPWRFVGRDSSFLGRWKSPTGRSHQDVQVPKMEVLEPQLFLGLLSSGFFAGLIPLFLGQQENLMFFFGLPPKIMGIGMDWPYMHGGIVDFIYLLIDPSKNQPFMDWSNVQSHGISR